MLLAALSLLLALLALEWFFWLSPSAPRVQALTARLGERYCYVPFHYWARLAALGAVLLWWRPAFSPLAGSWLRSLGMGGVLCLVALAMAHRQTGGTIFRRMAAWYRRTRRDFWEETLYILLYPALVEELLFRWFFVAAATGLVGWHALWVAPAVNILWHLPVWWSTARSMFRQVTAVGTVFACLLTLVTALSGNLLGAVLAHWFADWINIAAQQSLDGKRAA